MRREIGAFAPRHGKGTGAHPRGDAEQPPRGQGKPFYDSRVSSRGSERPNGAAVSVNPVEGWLARAADQLNRRLLRKYSGNH